jgi:adenine-specific DNA-methyltransferase
MAVLNFKGKAFVQNYHLQVKYHQLIPRKDKSLTSKVSLHDNLIVHGDNLKALKALLPTYAGKIKCIYIDPPYNTGNEKWAYNDNVNSPMMQDWLGKIVDKEDLTRHDKWLCMMTPRLKLLRELLKEDGAIFVSIDDNEVQHLRMLMDEIFGEENFIATLIWNTGRKSMAKLVAINHEYCAVYAKNKFNQEANEVENCDDEIPSKYWRERKTGLKEIYSKYAELKKESGKNYENISQGLIEFYSSLPEDHPSKAHEHYYLVDGNGIFFPGDISQGTGTGGRFEILHPITKKPVKVPSGGWRFNEKNLPDLLKENRIHFGKDETVIPCLKRYLHETEFEVPSSVFYKDARGANKRLKDLFNGKDVFNYPKDEGVIQKYIRLLTANSDIILDSFAGSGTTAHAVLALNKEDGGNRRFILVECEDYADKITAERVRRIIKGVPNAKLARRGGDENLKKGFGGTFSYFDLGPPIEMESILSGDDLPNYKDLARYVFYTATGEEFDEKAVDEKRNFIGESREYLVYLFYKPNIDYLKATALTLDKANALGPYKNKKRLVFAPTKYLDQDHLDQLRIDFAQLPFEIYKLVK